MGVTINPEQLEAALVEQINVQLDIPWLNDAQEATVIRWAVRWLVPLIPPSVIVFLVSAVDGIDAGERQRLEDVLVAFLNSKIDFPVISESSEEAILRPIVRAVMNLAAEGAGLKVST